MTTTTTATKQNKKQQNTPPLQNSNVSVLVIAGLGAGMLAKICHR